MQQVNTGPISTVVFEVKIKNVGEREHAGLHVYVHVLHFYCIIDCKYYFTFLLIYLYWESFTI